MRATKTEPLSKRSLKSELLQKLTLDLEALELAQKATVAGATHAEAKPENDKDTRALEQTYLARGQALRVESLRVEIAEVRAMDVDPFPPSRPCAIGALITVETDDDTLNLLLAPHGGGIALSNRVQVVTPKSPLGEALLGKYVDDECEVRIGKRLRSLVVTSIA